MNCRLTVILLGVMLALAAPGSGSANNGIEEFEIPYTEIDYVPCLGEDIEFDVTVTVRTHLVATPAGGIHYVENWFIEGTALGLDSGLTWYGQAASPYAVNFNGAHSTEGWILAAMYEPLDGGRKFRKSQRLRIVFDANGVARVEHVEPYQFHCIGP